MQRNFYGDHKEILLDTDFDVDRIVVFLPGISGKAHSDRFEPLVKVVMDEGYALARLNLWSDVTKANNLSYAEIFAKLDVVFSELERMDYTEIVVLGKSFGGGVALAYQHQLIRRKILWAPAIGLEKEGNLSTVATTKLAEIGTLLDVTISESDLADTAYPIRIIHGDNDTVIPLENSQKIIACVPNGKLDIMSGGDHSFKTPESEASLMTATQQFLIQ